MMAYAYGPWTLEVEIEGSPQIWAQPGLYSEAYCPLLQKRIYFFDNFYFLFYLLQK